MAVLGGLFLALLLALSERSLQGEGIVPDACLVYLGLRVFKVFRV